MPFIRTPTTDEIGLFIRDKLDNTSIESLNFNTRETQDHIVYVDGVDPNNLRLNMESGAVFVIRVVRES